MSETGKRFVLYCLIRELIKKNNVTSTLYVAISLESLSALANVVRGQIATLRVGDTTAGELWELALVNVSTVVPIAFITLVTGTKISSESVCAVAEDVTGPVLALVLIGHITAFASVAVVTIALRI